MKYSREQLVEINLYSLRNLAREIGVKAPTSFKKQELIDEILLIDSGKKQAYKSNKGRPAKDGMDHYLSSDTIKIKKEYKKQFINCILKEIERKLNKIL